MRLAEDEISQLKDDTPITSSEIPVEDPSGAGDEINEEDAKEKEPTP